MWEGDVLEDWNEAENFEPSDSSGFISPPSADVLLFLLAETLPFHLRLRKFILHCLLKQQWLSLKEMPSKTKLMSLKPTNSLL